MDAKIKASQQDYTDLMLHEKWREAAETVFPENHMGLNMFVETMQDLGSTLDKWPSNKSVTFASIKHILQNYKDGYIGNKQLDLFPTSIMLCIDHKCGTLVKNHDILQKKVFEFFTEPDSRAEEKLYPLLANCRNKIIQQILISCLENLDLIEVDGDYNITKCNIVYRQSSPIGTKVYAFAAAIRKLYEKYPILDKDYKIEEIIRMTETQFDIDEILESPKAGKKHTFYLEKATKFITDQIEKRIINPHKAIQS